MFQIMKTGRDYYLLSAICLIVFAGGLIVYFSNFNGQFAKDQNIYGQFGSFISPFLTLISIILLSYISLKANKVTEIYHQIQLQPLLYLNFQKCQLIKEQEVWVINNGFDAPAINILIRFNIEKHEDFTQWVNCFSLNRSNTKTIDWMRFSEVIEIMWTDITNQRYFKMVAEDWTSTTTNISKADYEEVLKKIRDRRRSEGKSDDHSLQKTAVDNISDLISRSFEHYFVGQDKSQFNKSTYREFLKVEGLF
jgi:hypothetical protein